MAQRGQVPASTHGALEGDVGETGGCRGERWVVGVTREGRGGGGGNMGQKEERNATGYISRFSTVLFPYSGEW